MAWPPIQKYPASWRVTPNLTDYVTTYQSFSWQNVRNAFAELPGGNGLNIAYEAVDRHAQGPEAHQLALRWLGAEGAVRDFTYADLREQSNQFANVLQQLQVGKGDRVFVLAGRIPELYIAALGTLKNTSVFCPLFSAFGPEPIFQRLQRGDAKVLVTTARLFIQKIAQLLPRLPLLEHVLLADATAEEVTALADTRLLSLPSLMAAAATTFTIPPTAPEDMAVLHFTSGTTGMPKGAIHVHNAIYTHYITGKYVLDLHPGDVFWCTADPGWVTGTSYGIIAPLLHGVVNIVDEADFNAERWYQILEEQKVTVWYTAPTAIRRLMRLDLRPREQYDLSNLRLIHSVGEPLNPEAVAWGLDKLGLPIHDNWWQTETGGIMIANYAAMEIRPGSMGRPLPGIEAAIVRRFNDEDDKPRVAVISEPDLDGDLALKPGWPSMFRGYLHDEERYRKCFVDGWYLTGDLARRDKDGYFWFIGRADDIIKTAGHMVGPFEVESALLEHPAVAEAGVVPAPDPIRLAVPKAYIVLAPGTNGSPETALSIFRHCRERLAPFQRIRRLEFSDLPKTISGKIRRVELRQSEQARAERAPGEFREDDFPELKA